MTPDETSIRAATRTDLPRLGALAEALVRLHHGFDPARFFLPERVAEGYERWFGRELEAPEAILLVAEDATGAIIGYAYGRVEARDWNLLLDRHAALHDIFVDERARRRGVAEALLTAFLARARERGAPRAVLHTATQNARAQALFRKLGFRSTMVEMTAEL